jgi:hypothetical protein
VPRERDIDLALVRRTVTEIAVVVVTDERGHVAVRDVRRALEHAAKHAIHARASVDGTVPIDEQRPQIPQRAADDEPALVL